MTKFLASVSNLQEAKIVLDCSADIIDLKNPVDGALGALEIDRISEIVEAIGGRRPISATVGDLPMNHLIVVPSVEAVAQSGVDYIKIGLSADGETRRCVRELSSVAGRGIKLVGVLFADQHLDLGLIEIASDCGFTGIMIDTANKMHGHLLNHITPSELDRFINRGKKNHLMTGLAGSLSADQIPMLLPLEPDYLGFRGALCVNENRIGRVSRDACRKISSIISARHENLASVRLA